MKIIRFEDAVVTKWSGGETYEILIHPEGSDFKSGDYDLRISVATVNLETTIFTSLPGVNRILTVLEGNLTLMHEGYHTIDLKPYEQDRFQGDWVTRSKGKVRDFNVMWKRGAAAVKHMPCPNSETVNICADGDLNLLFVATGAVILNDQRIARSNSILFNENFDLLIEEETNLIQVTYCE